MQNVKQDFVREELRQTQIMTILSEKRTILSELRTWITMILFPISFLTALLAVTRALNIENNAIFNIIFIASIVLIFVIIFFVLKNLRHLFLLNKKINRMELP